MVPKQPSLDAAQGEQLLQIVLGILDDHFRTGRDERVFEPLTLLNASRLMLVPELAESPRVHATLGMLHWIRCQATQSDADFDAACRFFSHVYPIDPGALPIELREQFFDREPRASALWDTWHALGLALAEEWKRDGGVRLLDHAIFSFRTALACATAANAPLSSIECSLGTALCRRFDRLRERDDLDDGVAALQRAAQTIGDSDRNRELICATLGDALAMRWRSTRALADVDGAIAAYRLAGRPARFALASAIWYRFELTGTAETLAEAIEAYEAIIQQPEASDPPRCASVSALSTALIARYRMNGDSRDLDAALGLAEMALAEAPADYELRDTLVHNLVLLREARAGVPPERELLSKLRPYVAPAEILPREVIESAPEILPGIVVAVAVEDAGRIRLIPTSSLIEIVREAAPEWLEQAPGALRQLAIENLRRLPLPPLQILKPGLGADTDILHLEIEDPFIASRVTFLDELVRRIAPECSMARGVLVTLPRPRTLQLHFPSGPGVVQAFEFMKIGAAAIFAETPDKLSPYVFYIAPDGRSEIVTSLTDGGRFSRSLLGRDGLLA